MAVLSGATASGRQFYAGSLNGTGSAATVYTAPSLSTNVTSTTAGTSASTGSAGSATAYIKEIIAANTNGSAGASANFTIWIVPSGSSASAANVIYSGISVNGGDSKVLSGLNTMMPAGSTLQATSSASGLTLTVSGTEVQ